MAGPLNPQNLVRQVSAETVIRPAGFYASIVLDVFSVGSAAALGVAYRLYLGNQPSFFLLAVAFGIFGLLALFGTFLGKSFPRRALVAILQGLALAAPFYDWSAEWVPLAAAVAAIFFLWGEVLSRRELNNNLRVRFFGVALPFLKKLVTASVIVGILLYLPRWDAKKNFVSEAAFGSIFDWAAGTAGKLYPEIAFNGTMLSLARSVARGELQKSQIFRGLAPAAQEGLVAESAAQVVANLGTALGTEVGADEQIFSFFYRVLTDWYRRTAEKIGAQFVFLWAVAVFFVVRGIGTIAYLVLALIAFAIYQLLLAANIIVIVGESQVHEVVEYA